MDQKYNLHAPVALSCGKVIPVFIYLQGRWALIRLGHFGGGKIYSSARNRTTNENAPTSCTNIMCCLFNEAVIFSDFPAWKFRISLLVTHVRTTRTQNQ
jgi:hypothetical protein